MSFTGKLRTVHRILSHRREREFFLQRLQMRPTTRAARAARVAAGLPSPTPSDSATTDRYVSSFREDGYVLLPEFLDEPAVTRLRLHFEARRPTDVHRPELGDFEPLTPPSVETNVAYYNEVDVLAAPGILDLANDPLIIDLVSQILGAKPLISYMAAWWTYPSAGASLRRGELFHRDVDDWAFVKVFTYLTDVDDQSGPHQFITGSQDCARLCEIRNFDDKVVFENFDERNVCSFTGSAGTTLVENTFGLHRGTKPFDRPRLIYQTLYSLRQTIYGPRKPIAEACGFESSVPLDPYTNGVYLRF